MPKATNTPGPLKAAAVVCAVVFAGGCLLLAFRCSGTALPSPQVAQAFVMCHINANADLPRTRREVEALTVAEAKALLLGAADRLHACVSPSATTDDAGAP